MINKSIDPDDDGDGDENKKDPDSSQDDHTNNDDPAQQNPADKNPIDNNNSDPNDLNSLLELLRFLQNSASSGQNDILANMINAAKYDRNFHAKKPPQEESEQIEFKQYYDLALIWAQDALKEWSIPCTVPVVYTPEQWVSYVSADVRELYQPIIQAVAKFIAEDLKFSDNNTNTSLGAHFSEHLTKLIVQLLNSVIASQMNDTLASVSTSVFHGMDAFIPKKEIIPNVLQSNVISFAKDILVPQGDTIAYIAVREILLSSLFSRAKWLRMSFMSCFNQFSRGLQFNYQNLAQSLEDALLDHDGLGNFSRFSIIDMLHSSGIKIIHTDEQKESLARLANLVTLITGWVDVVADSATKKLKYSASITHMLRRRGITSSPFERLFKQMLAYKIDGQKFGLARNFWATVTSEFGPRVRDSLWDHPDSFPSARDLADYHTFLKKLKENIESANNPEGSELDRELKRLLENPDSFNNGQQDGDSSD